MANKIITPDTVEANFPFKSTLNLSSLIKYWEDNLTSENLFSDLLAKEILEKIKNATELKEPVIDPKILEKHKDLIGFLMSAVFPVAQLDTDLSAAMVPFKFESFFVTPAFQKILPLESLNESMVANVSDENVMAGKVVHACLTILNKFYGTSFKKDKLLLFNLSDKETGLKKLYKIEIDDRFVDVINKNKGKLKRLHKDEIRFLTENLNDAELWLQFIKPENFEFQGFLLFRLVDVTVEEMLSSIKYDLLQKDAVIDKDSFRSIQQKMRSVFNLPEMQLGLAAFDPNSNMIENQRSGIWNSIILNTDLLITCDSCIGSIYERVYVENRPIIIEDLETYQGKTSIEKKLLAKGIRNIALAPLESDGNIIGFLELATPYPHQLTPISANKFEDVLPMFTAAVVRVLNERQTQVKAIIQEECTSIHPTVEWRFLQAGTNLMNKRASGENAVMEDIVFEEVYPLYGLADIRGSSFIRSQAIQEDLMESLERVKGVIRSLQKHKKMPVLEEVSFRVGKELRKIKKGLASGDETSVQDFLKNEIVPLFRHFKESDDALKPIITAYEGKLDPKLGVIYNKRKAFEESLTKVNESISVYMDEVESKAQEIYPHYFEKYKTDGVEYNLYLGDSLVPNHKFDEVYLKNLRLSQMIWMCEIAAKVEELKNELSCPLDIAQLILVQGEPLSIKFRHDEKKFDVDGAYNIRYEIVKKRIDKAYIKDSNERLTQPGKLAIVYAQQKEVADYEKYISYLVATGYLKKGVEYLELEELQGARGLKALRVNINLDAHQKKFDNELLKEIVNNLNG